LTSSEGLTSTALVQNMYILKLVHVIDAKFQSRGFGGPCIDEKEYDPKTGQPPHGRARRGGQKMGEMEIWALQAWGLPLTIDDAINYRCDNHYTRRTYPAVASSIIGGGLTDSQKFTHKYERGIGETLSLVIAELRGLGIDISLFKLINDEASNLSDLSRIDTRQVHLKAYYRESDPYHNLGRNPDQDELYDPDYLEFELDK